MHIVTICGSPRPNSQTANALAVVNDALRAAGADVTTFSVETLQLNFPGSPATDDAKRMVEALRSATGIVLATPEYHGGLSSALKLAIENMGFPNALKGKPVVLLGVAGGVIGAVKSLEQLRSICAHVGALVLPGAVSVAQVGKQFDDDGRITNEEVEARLQGLANALTDYIKTYVCPLHTREESVRQGG